MQAIDTYTQGYLDADTFAAGVVGATIEKHGPDYALCALTLTDRHRNGHGIVMGGVLFTLADFAFAVACDAMHTGTVTAQSSIHFVAPARGGRITAEASCVHKGKTCSLYEVSLRDEADRLLAKVSCTGFHKIG